MYLHPLLSVMSPAERAKLLPHTELRSYRRNEVVKDFDDPEANIFCVANGLLRVVVAGSATEEEVTTDFIKPDELYLGSAFDETRHLTRASLITALPSSVYIVPWKELQDVCFKHPQVLVGLVAAAAKRTAALRRQLRRVSSMASEALISRALHELTELAPAGTSGYDKRITQAVIASYTGLSREKVNKTMRAFQNRGLVQKDGLGVRIPPHFASDFGLLKSTAEAPAGATDTFLLPGSDLFLELLPPEGMGDADGTSSAAEQPRPS